MAKKGMDRKDAELKLKQFIRHHHTYLTDDDKSSLYKECRRELTWNCKLCKYDDFMSKKNFIVWAKTFDWLKAKQTTKNGPIKWTRIDKPGGVSILGMLAKKAKYVIGGCSCRR